MKLQSKLLEHLDKYGYYMPQKLDQVSKVFYEQLVINLNLGEGFQKSLISQISKINTAAANPEEFRNLISLAWRGFISKVESHQLFWMKDQQEMKEFQNFVLRVFSEPKNFELMYVEELLMIYEIYFQSNKGTSQIIQRSRARLLFCKLVWSYFIKNYDDEVKQRLQKFFQDIYLKKIEKLEQSAPLMMEFFDDNTFFKRIFDVLFDQQEQQGIVLNYLKNLILKTAYQYKNLMTLAIDIITQFYQIYLDKEKFLYEKYEIKAQNDDKYIIDIVNRVQGNYDLKEYLKQLTIRLTSQLDYRKVMRELITQDIYSKECESSILISFFKEYEYMEQKRLPPKKIDDQQKLITNLLRQYHFIRDDKTEGQMYKSSIYQLKIVGAPLVIEIKNILTKKEQILRNVQEIQNFINNPSI